MKEEKSRKKKLEKHQVVYNTVTERYVFKTMLKKFIHGKRMEPERNDRSSLPALGINSVHWSVTHDILTMFPITFQDTL